MKKLDDKVTVAPQISAGDIPDIKAAGFTVVMCNRPDGEEPGQPTWADIRAAAEAAGLATSFLPMSNRDDAFAVMNEFRRVVDTAAGPVFAYCRSGARCEILWMTAQANA
ncbi:TIGR01244 family sulfur transferase [Aliiroseovarius sp. F47248L]|uniref:TIGR01244 family sulfur transferase n=1 Tax=Aliiroseovarius sp. F47248L TaxID=2926420 RepID=UPI001FF2ADD0|nr:TIGR01244 family sulfur transferase [Aliiroseovarius sp. F47248L]MCK0138640.1 TIGR01244 family sulfur transferase [Aliiroseovarius sp. F47248L]